MYKTCVARYLRYKTLSRSVIGTRAVHGTLLLLSETRHRRGFVFSAAALLSHFAAHWAGHNCECTPAMEHGTELISSTAAEWLPCSITTYQTPLQPVRLRYNLSDSVTTCQTPLQPVRLRYNLSDSVTTCQTPLQPVRLRYNLSDSVTTCQTPLQPVRLRYNLSDSVTTCQTPLQPVRLRYNLPDSITTCQTPLQPLK
jgi:hypothetical protein